jgi:hypothetical protein
MSMQLQAMSRVQCKGVLLLHDAPTRMFGEGAMFWDMTPVGNNLYPRRSVMWLALALQRIWKAGSLSAISTWSA